MAGGVQHAVRGDGWVLDLHHVVLDDKMLAPLRAHVVLEGAAGRAVGVEAGHTAVNVEGRAVEEAALRKVIQISALACHGHTKPIVREDHISPALLGLGRAR